MSLNWQEINLVLNEWRLDGALIQNIVQPDYSCLYMEFYQPGRISWVQICLQAGMTRLHFVPPPPKTKGDQPRFSEFLRSRIKGGRLTALSQWGAERIVIFEFQTETGLTRVLVRLWGNAANILALDEHNLILDAYYRRPQKQETSGALFTLPPQRIVTDADRLRFAVRDWPAQETGNSFNWWLAEHYQNLSHELDLSSNRERLLRLANSIINRLEGRHANLERQIEQNTNPERFKQLGEMILAFKVQIRRGSLWFDIDDWYNPGTTLRIELDPKLEAQANAERYFQKFQKARDGQRYIQEELAQVRLNLEKVRQLNQELGVAPDLAILQTIANSLSVHTESSKGRKAGLDSPRPGLSFESQGFPIFIGRNVAENDELLRRQVRGNDWWLHVRDYPGGYVFIKVPKTKTVPLEVLLDAAHLAVWYSRAKHEPEVDLFYTQVKYLRRAKHGTYGMVIPTRERNLHVIIENERNERLTGILNQTSQ